MVPPHGPDRMPKEFLFAPKSPPTFGSGIVSSCRGALHCPFYLCSGKGPDLEEI